MSKEDNSGPAPKTVGVIMDGNRRFAREHGEAASWGHSQGFASFKGIIAAAKENGVENLVAYCFSSENWRRSKEEVSALLMLFKKALLEAKEGLLQIGRIKFIGDRSRFPRPLQILMNEIEEKTKNKNGLSLYLALSYGGRDEIVRAAQRLIFKKEKISEKSLGEALDTKQMPDPDIIIRTGGEQRLSNFLMWQSAYSELFFTKTLWPAFTKEEFAGMLHEYGRRKRNFGV